MSIKNIEFNGKDNFLLEANIKEFMCCFETFFNNLMDFFNEYDDIHQFTNDDSIRAFFGLQSVGEFLVTDENYESWIAPSQILIEDDVSRRFLGEKLYQLYDLTESENLIYVELEIPEYYFCDAIAAINPENKNLVFFYKTSEEELFNERLIESPLPIKQVLRVSTLEDMIKY